MPATIRPRRSILYMPGSNPRAMEKGRALPADGLIFDLEDAVSPDAKRDGRLEIAKALQDREAYAWRELIVRVNGLDTPWGHADLTAMARAGADAILLPKVEGSDTVRRALHVLGLAGAPASLAIWCMIETPRGILQAEEIADTEQVQCIVMGTSDLTKDLQAHHTPAGCRCWCRWAPACWRPVPPGSRSSTACISISRTRPALPNSCRQGRDLGFDGRTLIHPSRSTGQRGIRSGADRGRLGAEDHRGL